MATLRGTHRSQAKSKSCISRASSSAVLCAVEELLANAVYHRSYAVNEPIVVELTPEKLTISSHPGFDRSITDADIARFEIRSRLYRNRRIGDFLKELHLIEGRNTGFPNAVKALRANGSPFPQIRMAPQRSYRRQPQAVVVGTALRPDIKKPLRPIITSLKIIGLIETISYKIRIDTS